MTVCDIIKGDVLGIMVDGVGDEVTTLKLFTAPVARVQRNAEGGFIIYSDGLFPVSYEKVVEHTRYLNSILNDIEERGKPYTGKIFLVTEPILAYCNECIKNIGDFRATDSLSWTELPFYQF